MNRQAQNPSSRDGDIPIEYVDIPHPGFKGEGSFDKTHPQIAEQWCYERNCNFGPEDFSYGSHVSAWWRCAVDPSHVFRQRIGARCMRGRGCPYCDGKSVSLERSLARCYPNIAKEWHTALNEGLSPFDLTAHSHTVVFWQCRKNPDHFWQVSVKERTSGRGCPHCRNERKLDLRNFPKALKLFDKKRNEGVDPHSCSTKLAIFWKCPKGRNHQWQARFRKRNERPTCPICRSLLFRFPKLAKQLHPTRNGKGSAESIKAIATRLVWWQCRRNPRHVWQESPKSRTRRALNYCPVCTEKEAKTK